MSKSSVASAPKLPTQLSQKSAWARGPPNSSSAPTPRSQSPAQPGGSQPATATHSRRPSTLGQTAVSFRDGVVGARSPVGATKSGSSVTFGSIDDDSAPISSSPASVPPIKSEAPKTFGSVAAAPASVPAVNGKPSTSSSASVSTAKPSSATTPATTVPKFDVKKLFQVPSSSPSPSQLSSEPVSSPSTRTTPLPQQPPPPQASSSHAPQTTQFGNHSFQSFVPAAGGLRPQPNGTGGNGPPRSPSSYRQVPNGTAPPVNGRPSAGPGTSGAPAAPMSAGMPSPRLGPPHPGQPTGMAPPPVSWNPYGYYGYAPPEWYAQQWMPHMAPPQHQLPHAPPMQGPPHQPPHHQQQGMPMSPRHPPSTLHPPGTPTLSPAVSAPISTPSPHMHTSSLSSVTSPPTTPASSTGPGLAGGMMDRNAKPFVPQRTKVVIKSPAGQEISMEAFKKHGPSGSVSGFQSPVSAVPNSPARKPVRLESEDAKRERLAEERRRQEKEEAEKAQKAKKEAERIRKEREEVERLQKEKEAAERRKKEEQEAERVRKEQEEKDRLKKEEERKRKEEEERQRKEEEEKERLRKEEEEKERLRREEEEKERLIKEAEEKAKAEAKAEAEAEAEAATAAAKVTEEISKTEEPEEGELEEASKEDSKAHEKPPLRLDTAVAGPSEPKKRPGPLDLSGTRGPIVPPLPSALATARIIDDLGRIDYPEGIKSPKVELNINAKQGKFRYDRDFLLQFMAVCKDKPDNLPPLDLIGLEPSDQAFTISRGGSGRRQSSVGGMGPPSSTQSRQPLAGLGISGFSGKPSSSGFNMGQFATAKTSEERFAMASRSASLSSGPAGLPFGRPSPMVRTSSQGGPSQMGSNRTRSQRGGKRGDKNAAGPSQMPSAFGSSSLQMMSFEPVAPLEPSANRWTPMSVSKKAAAAPEDSPEVVERKVKSLLNKLTMERFESISDQIIAWANKSEKEKDGRTLIQVIRLVFEKATDEATWSEMYARLCRKMMEQISPKVQDDGIKSADGKPITGGHLFRKYLLNRCQEDFERGWASKESTAAAAAAKAGEDQAAKAAAPNEETALYSEEYYAAQKAKRQGLGLIKFIGELFKLQMLTERIMHECVKKLLGNVENPEEEEIESLCQLLMTVGQILDTPKAHAHMDVYFSRMKELTKSGNVNSRMQFMLQDVLELRERRWIPRNQRIEPTTIAAVHEAAAKEKASQEKDQYNRTLSMSRGGSRRGGERGEHQQIGPDGWAVAGNAPSRAPPKAGDLSNFGKINKTTSMTFGPSSVFTAKEKKRESTISRTGSVNMFSMLSQNPELANEVQATSKSSRPPSRKPSIDLGPGGVPEAQGLQQRRKLNLLPRSIPKDEDKHDSTAPSSAVSEDESVETSMTEAQAKTRVDEDCKEFFNVRDLNEAEVYFTKLPAEHRHLLVDKLVSIAIDAKDSDVTLVASLFARAAENGWCSADAFEQGFTPTAELIDDIVIDVPKAFPQFAIMLKAAGLDEERKTRLASKSADSDKLLGLLTS